MSDLSVDDEDVEDVLFPLGELAAAFRGVGTNDDDDEEVDA